MTENEAMNEDIGQSRLKLLNSKLVDAKINEIVNPELKEYLVSLGPLEQKRYIFLMDKNDQLRAELEKVTQATQEFLQRERLYN